MSVDPTDQRHSYEIIADDLQERIRRGDLQPGERLPSERELRERYEVAQMTVRRALDVLRHAGLIDSRQGKGVFVRVRGTQNGRTTSARYRQQLDDVHQDPDGQAASSGTPFSHDHRTTLDGVRLDREFRRTPATRELAELFHTDPGTPLLERRFTFHTDGRPQQLSTSYLPLALVEGTPVADPGNEPWPGGTIAQLASLGVTVRRVQESVRARMPTTHETRALRIAPGVPVVTVVRVMLTGEDRDQPVEVADEIVIPSDRVTLDYTIDLDR